MDSLEDLTGFKHKITSAYHPQSNGLDEHFNQILKFQLQKLINDHQDDWDDLLNNMHTGLVVKIQQNAPFSSHVWSRSSPPNSSAI